MHRKKHRLQLALYARPKHPGTYHYALFVSPKSTKQSCTDSATKHHVKNTLQNISGQLTQPWRYERLSLPDIHLEQRLLVRIVIAKVTNHELLDKVFQEVPVYQVDDPDIMDGREFSCVTWVRDALGELRRQGAVAGLAEWEMIQKRGLEYVEMKKREERWSASRCGETSSPMFDMLSDREIIF